MVEMPIWGIVFVWVCGVLAGGLAATVYFGSRKPAKVDRTEEPKETKEPRPLNIFDAYSDAEIKVLRQEAAHYVKYYRKHGSEWTASERAKELRKIDDEIQARANAKLALEENKRTEHERDLAIFDTVYGEVLKRSEMKEIDYDQA